MRNSIKQEKKNPIQIEKVFLKEEMKQTLKKSTNRYHYFGMH